VDRILLTRITSPAFEQCDVYLPDFLAEKSTVGGKEVGWQRTSHSDLQTWVGFEVPEGMQQENGVEYEFQMWVRE
jgi:dihydrofolate reductase